MNTYIWAPGLFFFFPACSLGPMVLNLVLSDKVFFFAVSCSLGVPLQNTGGCSVISLEHFQILTLSCPKKHEKKNKKIGIYEIACKILKLNVSNLLSPMFVHKGGHIFQINIY